MRPRPSTRRRCRDQGTIVSASTIGLAAAYVIWIVALSVPLGTSKPSGRVVAVDELRLMAPKSLDFAPVGKVVSKTVTTTFLIASPSLCGLVCAVTLFPPSEIVQVAHPGLSGTIIAAHALAPASVAA